MSLVPDCCFASKDRQRSGSGNRGIRPQPHFACVARGPHFARFARHSFTWSGRGKARMLVSIARSTKRPERVRVMRGGRKNQLFGVKRPMVPGDRLTEQNHATAPRMIFASALKALTKAPHVAFFAPFGEVDPLAKRG